MTTAPQGPVAVLIGTRPEAIKLAPVIRALDDAGAPSSVFLTGQHVELVAPVLADLRIVPVENLNLMEPDQSLGDLSARLLSAIQSLLVRHRPRAVVVQGDTTTVAMGALCSFYQGIPVAHVEAGLRTGDSRNPFPEETNRRLVACLASLHFAPTERARENLLRENVPDARIRVVGNTVVDALLHSRNHLLPSLPPDPRIDAILASGRTLVLVTAHRRESLAGDLASLCRGIHDLAREFPDAVVVLPVHLNPNVQSVVRDRLGGIRNVQLLRPLPYLRFLQLLLGAKLVITDSGGVQEEAAALGIPFLVARRTTERPEGVESGVGELIGPDAGRLFEAARSLLTDEAEYRRRAVPTRAFGDGSAGKRIARAVVAELLGGSHPASVGPSAEKSFAARSDPLQRLGPEWPFHGACVGHRRGTGLAVQPRCVMSHAAPARPGDPPLHRGGSRPLRSAIPLRRGAADRRPVKSPGPGGPRRKRDHP